MCFVQFEGGFIKKQNKKTSLTLNGYFYFFLTLLTFSLDSSKRQSLRQKNLAEHINNVRTNAMLFHSTEFRRSVSKSGNSSFQLQIPRKFIF